MAGLNEFSMSKSELVGATASYDLALLNYAVAGAAGGGIIVQPPIFTNPPAGMNLRRSLDGGTSPRTVTKAIMSDKVPRNPQDFMTMRQNVRTGPNDRLFRRLRCLGASWTRTQECHRCTSSRTASETASRLFTISRRALSSRPPPLGLFSLAALSLQLFDVRSRRLS